MIILLIVGKFWYFRAQKSWSYCDFCLFFENNRYFHTLMAIFWGKVNINIKHIVVHTWLFRYIFDIFNINKSREWCKFCTFLEINSHINYDTMIKLSKKLRTNSFLLPFFHPHCSVFLPFIWTWTLILKTSVSFNLEGLQGSNFWTILDDLLFVF